MATSTEQAKPTVDGRDALLRAQRALGDARNALLDFRESCDGIDLHQGRMALGALTILQEYLFSMESDDA